MFWKRKPKLQPQPADPELAGLQAALAQYQERVATLELDLLNSQLELAEFNAELERRLGALQRQLEALQAQLVEARRMSARRALWGEQAASPDLPDDVITQYQRMWGPDTEAQPAKAPPQPRREPDAQTEADLKGLYRTLAKRFHPDLATDALDKDRRASRMAEVNAAYAAHDLDKLRQIAEAPDEPESVPAVPATKSRAEILAEQRAEIDRLAALAAHLESELDNLANTPAVQLKLEVLFARRAGRDLVAEMASDLQSEIRRAESELATLR